MNVFLSRKYLQKRCENSNIFEMNVLFTNKIFIKKFTYWAIDGDTVWLVRRIM